jgi:hypothetical protein
LQTTPLYWKVIAGDMEVSKSWSDVSERRYFSVPVIRHLSLAISKADLFLSLKTVGVLANRMLTAAQQSCSLAFLDTAIKRTGKLSIAQDTLILTMNEIDLFSFSPNRMTIQSHLLSLAFEAVMLSKRVRYLQKITYID